MQKKTLNAAKIMTGTKAGPQTIHLKATVLKT